MMMRTCSILKALDNFSLILKRLYYIYYSITLYSWFYESLFINETRDNNIWYNILPIFKKLNKSIEMFINIIWNNNRNEIILFNHKDQKSFIEKLYERYIAVFKSRLYLIPR